MLYPVLSLAWSVSTHLCTLSAIPLRPRPFVLKSISVGHRLDPSTGACFAWSRCPTIRARSPTALPSFPTKRQTRSSSSLSQSYHEFSVLVTTNPRKPVTSEQAYYSWQSVELKKRRHSCHVALQSSCDRSSICVQASPKPGFVALRVQAGRGSSGDQDLRFCVSTASWAQGWETLCRASS